ncbi:MAG: extracellular solute-binding protein [Gemmatimonadaceae bacterium]|nr:extracellular solute-binding protein [Gemmatimonadaceae bacterium]
MEPRRLNATRVIRVVAIALLALLACCARRPTLTVFNAAALGPPFRDALAAAAGTPPTFMAAQENAPSLEVVRKVTELGIVPDILAVADEQLLADLILPHHASWYVRFGTNALVLAYGPHARFAGEINTGNWWRILQHPGVEVGRSDLRIDPSGYRADMVMQLAESFYGEPGLTARLRATIPERNVRRAEADLSAHLETGELDYGWTYENLAKAHGLRYVKLPPEIDLSATAFADRYAAAVVEIPGSRGDPPRMVRGAPIVFALTVPTRAAEPELAFAFVQYLLSPAGAAALQRSGFAPLPVAEWVGVVPAALQGVGSPRGELARHPNPLAAGVNGFGPSSAPATHAAPRTRRRSGTTHGERTGCTRRVAIIGRRAPPWYSTMPSIARPFSVNRARYLTSPSREATTIRTESPSTVSTRMASVFVRYSVSEPAQPCSTGPSAKKPGDDRSPTRIVKSQIPCRSTAPPSVAALALVRAGGVTGVEPVDCALAVPEAKKRTANAASAWQDSR